ncbi:target of Nesh-SH3 isoform X3 [Danio rerio]|uniref:Target of Nesh-SH3 isoform X3 n=2 Tax=Danio rerio TaxID=7955 RepID=A0AC58GGU0_DANRE|nr:target of Nesh-SH3 isoform X3 [Danio rerio]|eukprot:XP_009303057.1 target of Nesh-SH3 isoform X3 [Danio rerio]
MNSVLFSSRKGDNMQLFLLLLFLSKIFLLRVTSATTIKVPTQNMRVRISAVGDTVVFKFIRPHVDSRLGGYILGYGSSMFSKQFIQLPEDGQPYETEIDAEPKYLLAIQSNKPEEPKKQCAGKVDLEVPLNVVIGSVTESSVLLSWGTLLTSPFTDSIVDDCFDEGHFTVRYREQEPSNTWNYQTCPSSSTVIDNLKPDVLYEFGVRAETDSKCGAWSPPVIHNTDDQIIRPFKELNQAKPKKPILADQKPFLPPVPLLNNITRAAPLLELPKPWKNSVSTPETTSTVQSQSPTNDPTTSQPDLFTEQHTSTTPQQPATTQQQSSTTQQQTSTTQPTTQEYIKTQISTKDPPYTAKQQFSETTSPVSTTSPIPTTTKPQQTTTKEPDTTTQENLYTRKTQPRNKMQRLRPFRFRGRGIFRNSSSVSYPLARNVTQRLRPLSTNHLKLPPVPRNSTPNKKRGPHGEGHIGLHGNKPRKQPVKPKLNQVSDTKEKEIITDLKQIDPVPELKPLPPPTTEKPANQELSQTTTPQSAFEGSRFDTDNSSVYSNHPRLELDPAGKKRFVAPHVVYRTDKRPEEPCSVTNSLSFFPDEEVGYLNVTGPPKTPPSNLTVVTVEGCSSFVILDWDKTDNETTEYEVVSSTKGPHGEEVSIQTTNQTHTAVENLKPESSYEFKVTPKNELGSGPSSDPVSFSTESADPRVSEKTSKNAIWSSFPFKADSYTECNGRQFIKRTWYRKFVGIQLCNSLRYKIYLSDSLNGKFYSIGDQTGFGEDHCQFVDSFLDGRTGGPLPPDQLPPKKGFYRAMRQEPVQFGEMGGNSMINYVAWYECGIPIPGKW